MEPLISQKPGRILSIDVMRGMIMILLAAESCSVYESLKKLDLGAPFDLLLNQFFHHRWHGLHFWDLLQPSFMLIAGTAMYISYFHKKEKGITWKQNFRHIALRSAKLFLLGTSLHCIYAGKLVWELWNVLTQLSFTTLIAYLVIDRSFKFQMAFSIVLLILTELLYRGVLMPNFDQPFVEHHNFGAYLDTLLMGKINQDGWVAINIIPTAAHTIWGVAAGKLLLSERSAQQKIKVLLIAALAGLILGFGLDLAGITPIIKRIATSSFTLASGGWVMLMMAFWYWLIDFKRYNRYAWIAVVVGANAIFIYLFFETVGYQWLDGAVAVFVRGFAALAGMAPKISAVISALLTWLAEWGICYWLAKNRVFIKL